MSETIDYLIVGSGPSAIAVAATLIGFGINPCIVDVGITPGTEAKKMQQDKRSGISASNQTSLVDSHNKKWFDSDHSYSQPAVSNLRYAKNIKVRGSFAKSGLSSVWGATCSTKWNYSAWPASCIPSKIDIQNVLDILNPSVTTNSDLFLCEEGEIPGSVNSRFLYQEFIRKDTSQEYFCEPSILAINSKKGSSNKCVACGTCLNGCAWDSIWNTNPLIDEWVREEKVTYLSGFHVNKCEEKAGVVKVVVSEGESNVKILVAKKVILSAGVIPTAAILMRSGMLEKVEIRDSSTAFGVMINLGKVRTERLHHNLSQFWINETNENSFMAQIYPSSTEVSSRIANEIGLPKLIQQFFDPFFRRIIPVISYMDDSESGVLEMKAVDGKILVKKKQSANIKIHKIKLRKLSRILIRTKHWMPMFLTRFSEPGAGYHLGGSLKHGVLTDCLGVPTGCMNIHVTDASVLPNISVGSITPTVMANAARISRCLVEQEN